MAAALVARERVDFVDDDGARRRQHLAARLRSQQDIERLGRRDDNMWRPLAHPRALGLRRIAGADQCANLHIRQVHRLELLTDPGQGNRQILLNIVGERLERRNVDDERLVGQGCLDTAADQAVDGGEKGSQGLPRTGGRGDQNIAPRLYLGPRASLRLRRGGKVLAKPAVDSGMKRGGFIHGEREPDR